MTGGRYVVLGLAHVRSPWFTEVSRWCTLGTLPVEFVKCLGVDELRSRLRSGRMFSAALLDARLTEVDRELLEELVHHGVAPLVVDRSPPRFDWSALGASQVLDDRFTADAVHDALGRAARQVPTVAGVDGVDEVDEGARPTSAPPTRRCPMVVCLSRNGTGSSTVAIALAQALARGGSDRDGPVVLADLALHAQHALLHDAGDVMPGLPELIDRHRTGHPTPDQIEELLFDVPSRGYRLLLGLRRHRDWVTVRPRSLRAAVDGLRSTARALVVEVDADLEGEAETGSFDIEDRNALARTAVHQADLVVVVARPAPTDLHGLGVLLGDLDHADVQPERILVVVNAAPLRPRARAELTRTIADLARVVVGRAIHHGPVFIPSRRNLDDIHLAVAPLPSALVQPVGSTVDELLHLLGPADSGLDDHPVEVVPGEVGHWRTPD